VQANKMLTWKKSLWPWPNEEIIEMARTKTLS